MCMLRAFLFVLSIVVLVTSVVTMAFLLVLRSVFLSTVLRGQCHALVLLLVKHKTQRSSIQVQTVQIATLEPEARRGT
jgi:hypothetical protein